MTSVVSTAPGKIILSGEYAVVFGFPGIAVPADVSVEAAYEEGGNVPMKILFEGLIGDERYARKIVDLCVEKGGPKTGTLRIKNSIPVGRGMGSSTALVIAICKCLLGEQSHTEAMLIEDTMNPGNSGLDFAVIWANRPVAFTRGSTPEPLQLNLDFLKSAMLIDTGKPGETTAELVGWMKSRETEIQSQMQTIGRCTERLAAGEDLMAVMRDHHGAQVELGIVPKHVQQLILDIELSGGAAKVLGAGARTGGGGMVLALHEDKTTVEKIAEKYTMPVLP